MKTSGICFLLALCLLLSGCLAWPDGHYVSVKPHADAGLQQDQEMTDVKTYNQLLTAVQNLVESGKTNITISVENYSSVILETELQRAIRSVCNTNPIGAYAVESIHYEFGVTGGKSAISLTVEYNHNQGKIGKMQHVKTMDAAVSKITQAMDSCASELVIRISGYRETDYVQLIADYAAQNPNLIMEIPQITVNVYPETGSYRVLELLFTYQSSRDSLRSMQSYVQQIFASSTLYVSGEEDVASRYDMLATFLMERNDYKQEISLTPAYSLLRHGVGDIRAFAIVYEAMCKKAGMECMTVSGTRAGEQWYWNIICQDGVYYHLDLVQSHQQGGYLRMADADMNGYVWDYSAYPVCGMIEEPETTPPETTEVAEDPESTEPTETSEETQPAEGIQQPQTTEPAEPLRTEGDT